MIGSAFSETTKVGKKTAYSVLQDSRKDMEKGTRSAADLISAAKADDCVDLTDTPASPLRKRDSQGNPKIGGKSASICKPLCLSSPLTCTLSLYVMFKAEATGHPQDRLGARGSKCLSGPVSRRRQLEWQGGTRIQLTVMSRTWTPYMHHSRWA